MAIKIVLCLCTMAFLAFLQPISGKSDVLNSNEFHVSMDEDMKYLMDWTFDLSTEIMTFTVRVKTTGWVGFGISPYTGKMPGSDVVIGWVDSNGKAHLQVIFRRSVCLHINFNVLRSFKKSINVFMFTL